MRTKPLGASPVVEANSSKPILLGRKTALPTCSLRKPGLAPFGLVLGESKLKTKIEDKKILDWRLYCGSPTWLCPTDLLRAAEPVSFRNQIAPILLENCTSCHGPKKAEGGYRLDSFAQLQKPGDSGVVPLNIQDGKHSELLRRLVTTSEAERMPAEREPLYSEAIELIARWQAEGCKFDGDDPQVPLFELVPARTYAAAPESYRTALPITAIALSPDGSQVLASGYHELTVWDATSGKLVRRISNLPNVSMHSTGAAIKRHWPWQADRLVTSAKCAWSIGSRGK